MNDKKFIGNVKQITFNNGGSILKLGLKEADLSGLANEKGYINLVIAKKKEPLNDGKDYYCYVDEYKPQAEEKAPVEETPAEPEEEQIKTEDIPF